VRQNPEARRLAEKEKVDIELFEIIYNAIEAMKKALAGLLEPDVKEVVLGFVRVKETFRISNVGTIAGCYVEDGVIHRNDYARLLRDNVVINKSRINSLKRFKDDVREVNSGYECGLTLEGYNDIKVNDVIEVYEMVEEKRSL